MAAAASLTDLKVYELKAVCRAKGLKVSGKKAELISRIQDASNDPQPKQTQPKPKQQSPKSAPKMKAQPPASISSSEGFVKSPINGPPATSKSPNVQILSSDDADASDKLRWRQDQRRRRRSKLSEYFDEEFNKVVGELATAGGEEYMREGLQFLQKVEIGVPGAGVDLQYVLPAVDSHVQRAALSGHRLAWCKEYDVDLGLGKIVDLLDRKVWEVDVASLAVGTHVPLTCRYLSKGEFVEYSESAARAALEVGKVERSGWVCGLRGWPLMCEAQLCLEREEIFNCE